MPAQRPNSTWICSECEAVNDCTDYACECEHEREALERRRWAIIERGRYLSPRDRRALIGRAA